MKRIMLAFSVILYLTMIIGCATVESLQRIEVVPGSLIKSEGVILTQVPSEGLWLSPTGGTLRPKLPQYLAKGKTITLSAIGYDASGNSISIVPSWKASVPGIVEITPEIGETVEVKGLKEGATDIVVCTNGITYKISSLVVQ